MRPFIFVLSLIFCLEAQPCTSFGVLLNQNRLLGKSYDWYMHQGLVFVNKRGVTKSSLALYPTDLPTKWTARFSSVTFNQFGLEFPNGGINEKGLAIEIMWLTSSIYPVVDARETVNELQWIQYMLDNYRSVPEMILNADRIRVARVAAPVHYLACDSSGSCATFEYINGKLVMHSRDTGLTVPVLANNTYEDSVNELINYTGFGGNQAIPAGVSSLERFVRAASKLRGVVDVPLAMKKQAFTILDSVVNPAEEGTVWQIVYDLVSKQAHFKTRLQTAVKTVDLATLGGNCHDSPVQYLDLQTNKEGNVTSEFTNFDAAKNQELISQSIHMLKNFPGDKEAVIKIVADYPNSTTCN